MKNQPAFPIDTKSLASVDGAQAIGLTKLEYAAIEAMKGLIVAYPQATRNEISGMARDQALDLFKCLSELEKANAEKTS